MVGCKSQSADLLKLYIFFSKQQTTTKENPVQIRKTCLDRKYEL